MGKLNDFNFLQPIENNNNKEKEVNYEDFKKLINSKEKHKKTSQYNISMLKNVSIKIIKNIINVVLK